jgi:hypothetical protein
VDQPDPSWCARLRAGSTPRPRRVVDRVDFDPSYDPSAPIPCEICGSEMRYTAACKLACGNCGYKRDCSDP